MRKQLPYRYLEGVHLYNISCRCAASKADDCVICYRAFGELSLSLLHLFALISFLAHLIMSVHYSSTKSL